jgi:hypothetical protein
LPDTGWLVLDTFAAHARLARFGFRPGQRQELFHGHFGGQDANHCAFISTKTMGGAKLFGGTFLSILDVLRSSNAEPVSLVFA